MNDAYLSAFLTALLVLGGVAVWPSIVNGRISDLNTHMNHRIDDLRAELARLQDRMARGI